MFKFIVNFMTNSIFVKKSMPNITFVAKSLMNFIFWHKITTNSAKNNISSQNSNIISPPSLLTVLTQLNARGRKVSDPPLSLSKFGDPPLDLHKSDDPTPDLHKSDNPSVDLCPSSRGKGIGPTARHGCRPWLALPRCGGIGPQWQGRRPQRSTLMRQGHHPRMAWPSTPVRHARHPPCGTRMTPARHAH